MNLFSPEMLVFIDESGADHRDCLRKLGYLQLRGKPAQALQFFVNCGMYKEFLNVQGWKEVCGSAFKTFLEEKLSPLLHPFNGTNPPSVITIHQADGVVAFLQNLGVLIYFLPPYNPDIIR